MATETTTKATLGQRAVHEFKELAILTAFLYVTLGAVILMKAAVLHGAGVSFIPWGIAIVKALVLAKFMLIGRAMIGERFNDRPLTWPTLYKSFAFLRVADRPDRHRGSRRWPLPPPVGRRLARRTHRRQALRDPRRRCSFRISLGASSTRRLAKGGWRGCFFVDRGWAASSSGASAARLSPS
jgi:hypothetical protein